MAGILEKFKGKKGVDIEEYLDTLGMEQDDLMVEHADMWVRPYALEDVIDVERVANELRKGNMVLLNIEPLFKKNAIKLRQAISELKGTVHDINGDIARITEHKLLVTPANVKIAKQ
jgi:SepF-like predicted cell division protein (DUF552 family)